MIRRITSNQKTFKTLVFGPGLNLLLAEKSEGATDRQSRNGAGKTSFVELVHFLLGSNARSDSIFRSKPLIDWVFEIELDIEGATHVISRAGKKPSRILVIGPIAKAEEPDGLGLAAESYEFSNEQFKNILGRKWYGIEPSSEENNRFGPTFRSVFSYFARRQGSGAFQTPSQHSARQQLWDQQVAISYLLGLDWTISKNFQILRGREKIAKELGRAARSGELGNYFGRAADLRTRLAVISRNADQLRTQMEEFRVVPEYRRLEAEADELTGEINALIEANLFDREAIRELQLSFESEQPPNLEDLHRLYAEAGVVVPELLRRRFEELEEFHQTIIENRRSHLQSEMTTAERRVSSREQEQDRLDGRRQQIMTILRTGGALEHYSAIREELGTCEAEVEAVRQRLELAETLESTRAETVIERSRLTQALRDDIHERKEFVEEAIVGFEELSEALYERAGSLTIDATPNGPVFDVKIEGQRSKGITNMQMFCFDFMIAELRARRGEGPGFLIHDSHLFDGVDERQVAKALQLGAERSLAGGFQYIVTMNSDVLPRDGFRAGFDLQDRILSTRLSDSTDTGGLFGVRFS